MVSEGCQCGGPGAPGSIRTSMKKLPLAASASVLVNTCGLGSVAPGPWYPTHGRSSTVITVRGRSGLAGVTSSSDPNLARYSGTIWATAGSYLFVED